MSSTKKEIQRGVTMISDVNGSSCVRTPVRKVIQNVSFSIDSAIFTCKFKIRYIILQATRKLSRMTHTCFLSRSIFSSKFTTVFEDHWNKCIQINKSSSNQTTSHTVYRDVLSFILVLLSLSCPFVPWKSLQGQLRDNISINSVNYLYFADLFLFIW